MTATTQPPDTAPRARTRAGDPVDVCSIIEPHASIDTLTPLQISTLLSGQRKMRAMYGEPEPTFDAGADLIAAVERIRLMTRILELTLAGHVLLDREEGSEISFRFCRYWVAPDPDAKPEAHPGPQLLGPDGQPAVRNGPGLLVPLDDA